jgi:flagellar protein FliT
MKSEDVISIYESVAETTARMLTAARNGDWDELATLESVCTRHIDRLKSGDVPPSAGALRERKIKIIHQILEDDRQIRALTEPWMAHLAVLINSSSAERKLSQAYGAHQSG